LTAFDDENDDRSPHQIGSFVLVAIYRNSSAAFHNNAQQQQNSIETQNERFGKQMRSLGTAI
jgi:hypothetical protein